MKPGIHYNMPARKYHADPAISRSDLELVEKSVHHYLTKDVKHTKALDVGSAVHIATLEPLTWRDKVHVAPVKTRTAKAWVELQEANPDITYVNEDEILEVGAMRDAILAHPKAKNILQHGRSEVSMCWVDKDTGLLCKCRYDFLRDDHEDGIDIKTTEDASYRKFYWKSVGTYEYYVQFAYYFDGAAACGINLKRLIWIVVEKNNPTSEKVAVYLCPMEVDRYSIEAGRVIYKERLRKLADYYKDTKQWTGYPLDIQELCEI